MRKILEKILAVLARKIIGKYKPKIVGITGSIGKTSAKEASFAVLSEKFDVRRNIKNYNNEIGVPLTVIGEDSAGKSILGWGVVFIKAIKLILFKNKYPEVLVLEMGADKPGDIGYLVKIAKPVVSVVTKVSPTHIEFFKDLEGVAREKSKIVSCLGENDTAILNFDDKNVMEMKSNIKSKVLTFGHNEQADVSAIEFTSVGSGFDVEGVTFKVKYQDNSLPVSLPRVVGAHQMNCALIGASVGIALGMNLVDISNGLKKYKSPVGRMNILLGKNNTILIDDTYNSSPEAAKAAVVSVASLDIPEMNRKVAILGDMLELGDLSDEEHFELGVYVAQNKYDVLVAVGAQASKIVDGAKQVGIKETHEFVVSDVACEKIDDIIDEHDLILLKGSQGSRIEKVTKCLLREGENAKELLVRQTDDWE